MTLFHLLNRGVDKRKIFLDDKDRFRFIHDLFEFNNTAPANPNVRRFNVGHPMSNIEIHRAGTGKRKLLVRIHAFCLMQNHYHMLVSPILEDGIPRFMKKLNMGYAKYFNERYKRTGTLWQGKYKSVPIETDRHFLHIPYYIHFNPLDLSFPEWRDREVKNKKKALEYLKTYRWSSHLDYLGIKNFPSITQREFLLDLFEGEKGYAESLNETLEGFSAEEVEGKTLE